MDYENWATALMVMVALPLLGVFFFLICYSLAQRGILFTLVQEGTAQAIMRGKSFHHMVMSYHGYHLNDHGKPWFDGAKPVWEVLPNDWKDFPSEKETTDEALAGLYDDRYWFEKVLGAYYVGLPPFMKVRWYKFEWTELQLNQKDGHEQIRPRAEPTNFVFVSDFTYPAIVEQLKTKDLLEVSCQYNRTVRITNPYKAMFRTPAWLRRVGASTDREAKEYIGNHTYEALQTEPDEVKRENFSIPMRALSDKLLDDPEKKEEEKTGVHLPADRGLKGFYGVTIMAADLLTVELSGDGEQKNNEAATQAYRAEQEATATRTKGKAAADVIKMTGKAEAKSLKARLKVIQKAGPTGLAAAQFDAIIEASKNPAALIIEANDFGGAASGVVAKAAAHLATASKPVTAATPAEGGSS